MQCKVIILNIKQFMKLGKKNEFIIIDSKKHITQKSQKSYYRVYVNSSRVKSADQFCEVLKTLNVDINLKNDDTTTTYKLRESLEFSSSFFKNEAEGVAATALANSMKYLQEKRNDREHPEDVGATVVVIPYNKSLKDYKKYLRQFLTVSMEVNDSALFGIFCHESELHDGAIFVRGNRIIAVKAFFRMTGLYKNKPSIGHGTRHASAQEFSKNCAADTPLTFVLSEEDGLIRSCIAGEIKKIDWKNIPKLILQTHLIHKRNRKKIKIAINEEKKEEDIEQKEEKKEPYLDEGGGRWSGILRRKTKLKHGENSNNTKQQQLKSQINSNIQMTSGLLGYQEFMSQTDTFYNAGNNKLNNNEPTKLPDKSCHESVSRSTSTGDTKTADLDLQSNHNNKKNCHFKSQKKKNSVKFPEKSRKKIKTAPI